MKTRRLLKLTRDLLFNDLSEAHMPKIEVKRRTRLKAESWIFIEFANNNTSQSGEDGIIDKIFNIITPASKFCVEFGAWGGVHLSNTWTLINDMGWEAVLIEGNEEKLFQKQECRDY